MDDTRYEILWAPAAVSDLADIVGYIAVEEGPAAADRVYERIIERIACLSLHPARCRVVPELREIGVTQYRELIVAPYRVLFKITTRVIGVIGVLDGRRDLAELLIRRTITS